MRATKVTTKTEIKLTVDIRLGQATPAQKAAWRKFWAKLLSEAKREQ